MTLFNRLRLTNEILRLDVDSLRRGHYSDKYFENIARMLRRLAEQDYTFAGRAQRLADVDVSGIPTGDVEVDMQWFTRHRGETVVAGVDAAVEMLRHCAGQFDASGAFDPSWSRLGVEAVHDGAVVHYDGDPLCVQPVLRVRGRYRDFAMLETPTLGVLTRASRVATNVYGALVAARGKPVLFFPARFDLYQTQAADGYAYHIAVQRYNHVHGAQLGAFISTDEQGAWWGGAGGGTVAHAAIACFLGDTAETMMAFASTLPPEIPRIALVDFNNDSVRDALAVMERLFLRYRALVDADEEAEARKYVLLGVRLDTSGSMRDASLEPRGDAALDLGVNPRLVETVRRSIDSAWERWSLAPAWRDRARAWCRNVKIVATGGFSAQKIAAFERAHMPVDIYGVGSAFFANHGSITTDFTADVVRVKLHGAWHDMAKVGRAPGRNPDLEPVI